MKIYDGFTFFNELDLLEIRLNVLNDVVDYFILVEGSKTFKGEDKPFIFDENKARFAPFLHKIIHIKVVDYPEVDLTQDDNITLAWAYENFQRNAIDRGLTDAAQDDVIIISDVDEMSCAGLQRNNL